MTIKLNKKSVVMTAQDGGKYRLDLTNMKIYDVTEKGKIRKLEILNNEIENALYELEMLKDSDIKKIKYQMKFEK
jgi:hypothetical protein